MNEHKQIEQERWDMAKIMADNFRINDEEWDDSDFEWAAHCLQAAGYHKQSEGEWIVCGMFDDFLKCSSCGDKHPWQTAIEYQYCPNCGAKMKGDAE